MSSYVKPLFNETQPEDYLNVAKLTADGLIEKAKHTQDGYTWEFSPVGQFSLYSGNAGILYFLLKLAQSTGDEKYKEAVTKATNYIIKNWDEGSHNKPYGGVERSEWCFYNGVTGIAFVLTEVAKYTGDDDVKAFAYQLIEDTINAARPSSKGLQWTGDTGVFFDSGIILFLIYAAQTYENEKWLDIAEQAGNQIMNKAIVLDEHRVKWPNVSATIFGLEHGDEMPNFFYSTTSGVSFTLAKLYEATKEQKFLETAIKGASYIESIAVQHDNKTLIPYSLPNKQDIYYLGLCHGAVGTSRLFYQLYKVTEDSNYKETFEAIIEGVINTGAPELHSPGYWNVTCQCCGSAGMSNLFNGAWIETHNDYYLELSTRVGNQLLSETKADDGDVLWYQAWNRTEPWNIKANLGYFDGAAGNAAELLSIYLANKNDIDSTRFPDDPYPIKL
ncbi:lanthionine synthetase LanC family protein [Staphylococcus gallinarum]|uniref:lanthionine synthetase LanC family protein n=1 Tax=Staphylococcus gallinarum TaxID=1293 RepID=UPI00319EA4B3